MVKENGTFNQIDYQNKYNKEHYDRVEFLVPKGKKAEIKAAAKANGQSVSEFVNAAVAAWLKELQV